MVGGGVAASVRRVWVGFLIAVVLAYAAAVAAGCSSQGGSGTPDASMDTKPPPSCGTGGTMCGTTCANLSTDPFNCGSCGTACGAGMACMDMKCVLSCPMGETACSSSCVNTQLDPNNCGTCNHVCSAGLVCSGSNCQSNCNTGQTLCGGSTSDAGGGRPFCADLSNDNNNCGMCGKVCPSGDSCQDSKCKISCVAGEIACNGQCIDPTRDNNYCGASAPCTGTNVGKACRAGESCVKSVCTLSCPGSEVACGGSCIDPTTSNQFCGASGDCTGTNAGTSCATGYDCVGGMCTLTCAGVQINCGGSCIDPTSNNTYCGASGNCMGGNAGTNCPGGKLCNGGTCSTTCGYPLTDCGGVCVNTQTDPNNCNGCGGVCTLANVAIDGCVGGGCIVGFCSSGYANCNGMAADGCEVNLLTDNNNCGTCGNICGTGTSCLGGTCSPCGRFTSGFTGSWTTVAANPFGPGMGMVGYMPANATATMYLSDDTSFDGYVLASNTYPTLAFAPTGFQGYGSGAWVANAVWSITSAAVIRYDISTNSWTTPISGLTTTYSIQTTNDDSGNIWSYASPSMLIGYNIVTGAVSYPSLTTGVSGIEPRISYDSCTGLLYLSDYATTEFYSYDPVSGAETTLPSLPGGLQFQDGFCGDHSGHIFTVTISAQMYQYTISTGIWTAMPTGGPVGEYNSACGVGSDGYLYASDPASSSAMYRIQLN